MGRARKNKEPLPFIEVIKKLKHAGINSMPHKGVVAADEMLPLNERIERVLGIVKSNNNKPTTMNYFIMYDIEDNKVRVQIAKFLIKKGCTRVQKSIFLANTERVVFNELHKTLLEIQQMYDNNDSLFFVPISTDELRAMKIIGKNIDIDLILNNRNTLFF